MSNAPEPIIQRVMRALGDTIIRESAVIQADNAVKLEVNDVKRLRTRMIEVENEMHVDIHCIVGVMTGRAQLYVKHRS